MSKMFEEMTVKELREEMGKRGLPKQENGKKFTKSELIERLKEHDDEQEKQMCDEGVETCVECKSSSCEKCLPEVKGVEKDDSYIVFAKTLGEIEKKYGHRKKDNIYENELKAGSFVVFVHYVEAANGKIYKKLRTAKVFAVNRKKEHVKVRTLLGTELILSYDELLYIKSDSERSSYPKDILFFLRGQRTEKGRELINERFAENVVTD